MSQRKSLFMLGVMSFFSVCVVYSQNPEETEVYNSQKPAETSVTYIDSLIAVYMRGSNIPGLAACIVKDDRTICESYYGLANIATQDSVNPSTIFMLASISKTVTASALMQLWEQGRFQLDDSINAYLPFPVRNPYFPSATITFRHLLTHSSSIRDGGYNPIWQGDPQIALDMYLRKYLTPGESFYSPGNYSNTSPPGVKVSYCNIGISLCGYLVEVISGVPFDQYCRDSIFVPLEMTNTAWFLKDLDLSLIAHPYTWYESSYHDFGLYGFASYPDGQLRTTVRSLAKWLLANINFGNLGDIRVLDSTTVRLMRTVEYWPSDWGGAGIGLVWQTWTFPNGRRIWYHEGRDKGVSTSMLLDEAQKTGVIILANKSPINEDASNSLLADLIAVADTLTVFILPEQYAGLPANYFLLQNYPNPFNTLTTINYELPITNYVELSIYDLLGQKVATLVSAEQLAGRYNVQWDATGFSSGLYFYRLETKGYVETKKLILMK